jgi:hypothetical protein
MSVIQLIIFYIYFIKIISLSFINFRATKIYIVINFKIYKINRVINKLVVVNKKYLKLLLWRKKITSVQSSGSNFIAWQSKAWPTLKVFVSEGNN